MISACGKLNLNNTVAKIKMYFIKAIINNLNIRIKYIYIYLFINPTNFFGVIMKICDRPEFKSKKPPLTFLENDQVLSAVKLMSKENFGSVVIVDKQHKVKGIVTERDLMKRLLNGSKNPKTTKLKDIMTSPVKVADQNDNLVSWLRQMSNERFRHLPVVDKAGKLINIMSQGDFVSYTWPNLLYQVKEMSKQDYFKVNQVVVIVFGILIYTLILYFGIKLI